MSEEYQPRLKFSPKLSLVLSNVSINVPRKFLSRRWNFTPLMKKELSQKFGIHRYTMARFMEREKNVFGNDIIDNSYGQGMIINRLTSVLNSLLYIFLCFVAKLTTSKPEVSILCYHSIGPSGSIYSVESEDFYKQMEYLRKKYDFVSLEDIRNFVEGRNRLSRRSVAITFDDGYLDNYLNAYPYFKQYDIPATIFVTTGFVGETKQLGNEHLSILTWNEIEKMSKNKIEIGAHTTTHPDLTQIDLDDARKEIVGCKLEIENRTGQEVKFFSYPFGRYNQNLLDLVKQLGFKGAVGGEGLIQETARIFVLNRVEVDRSVNFLMFKIRLTNATSYYIKLGQILKKMFLRFHFLSGAI